MKWQTAITHCHDRADPFAVATVISTTGSTPRDGSAKMVVTRDKSYDTIGGGQFEFKVIAAAREMLKTPVPAQKIDHFPLATKAGQCCGGSVTVLIESFPVTAMRLAVFGAGHVARALMQLLAQCDARIDWVDSREGQLPDEVSGNVKLVLEEDPVNHIRELSSEHRAMILTHDHALDYRLTMALLAETDIDYIGLIGSETKAKRFFSNLEKAGFEQEDLARVRCPVGLTSGKGKLPMEIAVSIAAQVLSLDPQAASEIKPDLTWKEIRSAFTKAAEIDR